MFLECGERSPLSFLSLYDFPDPDHDEPHIIRLRGPWEVVVESASDARSVRIHMPATWNQLAAAGIHGETQFRRRFHLPTGLSPSQRVDLVIATASVSGSVLLNSESLGSLKPGSTESRFEVSDKLRPVNRLEISTLVPRESDLADSQPIGEVRLEIYPV